MAEWKMFASYEKLPGFFVKYLKVFEMTFKDLIDNIDRAVNHDTNIEHIVHLGLMSTGRATDKPVTSACTDVARSTPHGVCVGVNTNPDDTNSERQAVTTKEDNTKETDTGDESQTTMLQTHM